MKKWQVVYTDQAVLDLRSVHDYIAFSLLEAEVAKSQTRRILEAIATLDTMPMKYRQYDREPWRSRGLRVQTIDNYMVFYLPNEEQQQVAIIRIFYGGRDIDHQLRRTAAPTQ